LRSPQSTSASFFVTTPGFFRNSLTLAIIACGSSDSIGEAVPGDARLLNRELSWLDYNARVLARAADTALPLLERSRNCAYFSSNLDEFFQVRVAGVKQQVAAGHSTPTPDGMSSPQVLDAIRSRVLQLQTLHSRALADVRSALAEEEIRTLEEPYNPHLPSAF